MGLILLIFFLILLIFLPSFLPSVVVITTAQQGSAQVQTLLPAYRRFAMVRICDKLKIMVPRLNVFRCSTIPQKQFIVWQAALKKTQVKLDLLNDIDIVLMVEKGIRGETCHAIHQYLKVNNE